jgi:hypothetical protein
MEAEREAFDNWLLNYWRNERGFGGMMTEAEHRAGLRTYIGYDIAWQAWQARGRAVANGVAPTPTSTKLWSYEWQADNGSWHTKWTEHEPDESERNVRSWTTIPNGVKTCPECGGEGICYRTQALDDCTACNGTGKVPAGVAAHPAPDHVAHELAAAHAQNSEAIERGWRDVGGVLVNGGQTFDGKTPMKKAPDEPGL